MRYEGWLGGGSNHKPLVTIEVRIDGRRIDEGPAFVDTGADTTAVPEMFAERLGVEVTEVVPTSNEEGGRRLWGGGGKRPIRQAGLELWHRGTRFCDVVVVAPGSFRVPILGRADFFACHTIDFLWQKSPPEFHVSRPNKARQLEGGTELEARSLGLGEERPWVPIEVRANGLAKRIWAIVVSGADRTILPAEEVADLGIKYEELETSTSNEASFHGLFGAVEMRPCAGEVYRFDEATGDVAELVRPDLLVAAPGRFPTAALGRADFFRLHAIRFEWHRSPPRFRLLPIDA